MSNLAYEPALAGEEASQQDIAAMNALRPVPRISIQAFCETEGVSGPIERAAEDRRMSKAHLKVHMGGIETAIEFYRSAPTPNLIILESRREPKELLESLRQLAEVCDPSSKVVVVGHYNDVWLYRELIRSGISEYVVAPVSMADIVAVISAIFVDPEADPMGRSIAFVGAKGGVGSSTIAHNIAWSMSNLFGAEVVVADLDLAFGTANINFDQDPAQGIAEAVFSPERIDEVYLDRLLAQCAEHLSLLAAPSTLDRVYDFDSDAFSQVIDIAQRSAPHLVLDVPHVWNGWTRTTLSQADEIVITATPELANLRNAKNLVDFLKAARANDHRPFYILNQVGVPKRPEIKPADFAKALDDEPVAIIPFEPQIFGTAANNGQMVAEVAASHKVAETFRQLAQTLTGRSEAKKSKASLFTPLLQKLRKRQS